MLFRSRSFSFADSLARLDAALTGAQGERLRAALLKRYPVALIDEFQDTDSAQWEIFHHLFGNDEAKQGGALLLVVGDPKQAIYGFRGGDLATYLAARSTASSSYQMRENRRSTPELIGALNHLLGERGLPRSALAMPPLEARAMRGGDGKKPIELLWLGGESSSLPSSTEVESQVPALVAAHIAQLLRTPPLLREAGVERPLGPDDICLLVSKHGQAELLRLALQDVGIASRLVSHADVFLTPAAEIGRAHV